MGLYLKIDPSFNLFANSHPNINIRLHSQDRDIYYQFKEEYHLKPVTFQ